VWGRLGSLHLLTAQSYSPAEIIAIDLDDNRLEMAKRFGATTTVNSSDGKAVEAVMEMTGKRGAYTVIEAVGIPATFELCEKLVAAGVLSPISACMDRKSAFTWSAFGTATLP
jgi:alcohol dehydrogenase